MEAISGSSLHVVHFCILLAVVLMGKNTMMRKAIRGHLENNPNLEKLLPHIKGNVGFVFTKLDLIDVRVILTENKVRMGSQYSD